MLNNAWFIRQHCPHLKTSKSAVLQEENSGECRIKERGGGKTEAGQVLFLAVPRGTSARA